MVKNGLTPSHSEIRLHVIECIELLGRGLNTTWHNKAGKLKINMGSPMATSELRKYFLLINTSKSVTTVEFKDYNHGQKC